MSELSITLSEIFQKQPHLSKWVVHMFQQSEKRRLAIITGAGTSADAGVPLWEGLVSRVKEAYLREYGTAGETVFSGKGPAYTSQVIVHRIGKSEERDSELADFPITNLHVTQTWAELLHDALYADLANKEISDIVSEHPYLRNLGVLIEKIPYILNFNFDDLLSDTVLFLNEEVRKSTQVPRKPPNVIWRAQMSEPEDTTTIFHINGKLPRSKGVKRSEHLVFTEDSFADSIVSANTPLFEQHVWRLAGYTSLIIGHSLEDASLKNLLRVLRNRAPSNIGYYIHWVSSQDAVSDQDRKDIFDVNLEVYNLITIFLTSEEIGYVCELLSLTEDSFRTTMTSARCETAFKYYVVGAVGSGKTSTLENLRHFWTFEEWPSKLPTQMYKRSDEYTDEEKRITDSAVDDNLVLKNLKLRDQNVGFFFMDRGPLDALAFKAGDAVAERRLEIQDLLSKRIENGEVCFLFAGGQVCEERNLRRGRPPEVGGDAAYLLDQSRMLSNAYGVDEASYYDAATQSAATVARKISLKALLGDYQPFDPNIS